MHIMDSTSNIQISFKYICVTPLSIIISCLSLEHAGWLPSQDKVPERHTGLWYPPPYGNMADPSAPGHTIQLGESFSIRHRKIKGRGLMVNNNCCNSGDIMSLTNSCSCSLDLLTIKCHQNTVCIPLQQIHRHHHKSPHPQCPGILGGELC